VELSGESANLAVMPVMHGTEAVYVEQAPAPHTERLFTESGRRVRVHCPGVGKTLLAYQP
jgi:IclR family transcriptional regulator, acetate operon repressor